MVQMSQNIRSLSVISLYAHAGKDEKFVNELDTHLITLKNSGEISTWNDQLALAGSILNDNIRSQINSADIILLFISATFLNEYTKKDDKNSNSYKDLITERRKKNDEVHIVPILLHPCDWQEEPSIADLQPLPRTRIPVTEYESRDQVWLDIEEAIKKIVQEELLNRQARLPIPAKPIPHQNHYFIGRKDPLNTLYTMLTPEKTENNRPVAIVGLGGVGKTQLAIEYMWRYKDKYNNNVLWAKANDLPVLVCELSRIVKAFSDERIDPDVVRSEQDPKVILSIVKPWLQKNSNWLLVLDNFNLDRSDPAQAEKMASIIRGLPHNGHILMTTRSRSSEMASLAELVEVNNLSEEEAITLLLLRAGLLTREETLSDFAKMHANDYSLARYLAVELLGRLPLALDQAAAYINYDKSGGIGGYIGLYQDNGKDMREKNTPARTPSRALSEEELNRETIAKTWSISFQKVEALNRTASELLRALSFLASEAIPEEIIIEGSSELGTTLGMIKSRADLITLVEILENHSLLKSNKDMRLLIIHRLVQEVLKDDMDDKMKSIWSERVIRAVNRVFPDGSIVTWEHCHNCQQNCVVKDRCSNKLLALSQRCLPHAQVCASYIDQYDFRFPEATELLHHMAGYLHSYDALYDKANAYYTRALQIRQSLSKKMMLDTATSHNDLARLLRDQYKYEGALEHFKMAIEIREQQHEQLLTAHSERSLARLYLMKGEYREAENLFVSALKTHQEYQDSYRRVGEIPREVDMEVATSMYGLAQYYHAVGSYKEAEELYGKVLEMDKNLFGDRHLMIAQCLDSLGCLYRDKGKFIEAEKRLGKALEIRRVALEGNAEPRHPETAQSLNDLGVLYRMQGRYEEAEKYIMEALKIRRAVLNSPATPDIDYHPDIAQSYSNLAGLYSSQERYAEAEEYYLAALKINREILGEHHPYTAHSLSSLADLYFNQNLNDKAELFAIQAFEIRERLDGPASADRGQSLYNMARLYYAKKDYVQAKDYYQKTLALDEDKLGSSDPRTIKTRKRYIELLHQMNNNEEAHQQEALLSS